MGSFVNVSSFSFSNSRGDRGSVKLTEQENDVARRIVSEICAAKEVVCAAIETPITDLEKAAIVKGQKMPFRTKKNLLGLMVHCMVASRVLGHKTDPVGFPKAERAWACDKGALLRACTDLNVDETFVKAVFRIEDEEEKVG